MAWQKRFIRPDAGLCGLFHGRYLCFEYRQRTVSIVLLHWILQIYTIVIVFEGVRRWLKIPEYSQTAFTVVATVIILVCPALIEFIFNKLSVILN